MAMNPQLCRTLKRKTTVKTAPKVALVDGRTLHVSGSSGKTYTIRPVNGARLVCDCPARGMCYHRSLGLALLAVDHGERAAKERANYERDTAHVPSPQRRVRDALFSDD